MLVLSFNMLRVFAAHPLGTFAVDACVLLATGRKGQGARQSKQRRQACFVRPVQAGNRRRQYHQQAWHFRPERSLISSYLLRFFKPDIIKAEAYVRLLQVVPSGTHGRSKREKTRQEVDKYLCSARFTGVTAHWASYMHLFAQETAQKEYVACAP